jgi:hypothetical protein
MTICVVGACSARDVFGALREDIIPAGCSMSW